MKNIKIYPKFWNVEYVRKHPKYLFIYGDNDIQRGKGGQAIIRDEPNALGIPTKKIPSYSLKAYYTDDEYEENKQKIKKSILHIIKTFLTNDYTTIILPKDGFGTGLAKLPEKAPKTFKYIENKIKGLIKLFNN